MDTKLECEVDAEGTVDMMFRGEELPYGNCEGPDDSHEEKPRELPRTPGLPF